MVLKLKFMKATGRFNKFTGQEIMEIEEHDIIWKDDNFEDLSYNEQADFLSFIKAPFLNDSNKNQVKEVYEYYRMKNNMEL